MINFRDNVEIDDIETYFSTPLPSQTKRTCALNVESQADPVAESTVKLGFMSSEELKKANALNASVASTHSGASSFWPNF